MPDEPPRKAPPSSPWARVFRNGFTPEDAVLYAFGLLLVWVLMTFFNHVDVQMQQVLQDVRQHKPPAVAAGSAIATSLQNRSLELQLDLNVIRYKYAGAALASRAARNNAAFLIGAVLSLMGTFIVIRGVREGRAKADMSVGENLRFSLATASPGALTILLGTIIIVVALVSREQVDVKDTPLLFFGSEVERGPREEAISERLQATKRTAIEYLSETPASPSPFPSGR